MKPLKFDLNNIIRANVREMMPYSSARDEFTTQTNDYIFLDANENPFDTNLNRYPDPKQKKLKQVLSKIKECDHANILLGNGSDEILDLIIRAFCEPKIDNIITLPPTYGMYKVTAQLNEIENNEVLLTPSFQLDLEATINAINSKTKIIFICSPNNPSGNLIEWEKIKTLLNTFNGLVVIDEAYIDFSEEVSWIKELEDHKNLVVMQTLSKAYGLAGLRIGMCFASKEIIAVLNRIKPPYNINVLSQTVAIKELLNINEQKDYINLINKEKERLLKALIKLNYIETIYPSDANFILIKVDNANLRYQQLLKKNIVVRNRSKEPLCENCLRITIGTEHENGRLIQILKSLENL